MVEFLKATDVLRRWPTEESAIRRLEQVRWGNSPVCPYCGSSKVCIHASKDRELPRWQCESCRRAFTVTVGTVFHHTHLPMTKWLLAIAQILPGDDVSAAQLADNLDLPYKTAWSLAKRLRETMQRDTEQHQLFKRLMEK